MFWRIIVPTFSSYFLIGTVLAVDVNQTDVFTATTRIDTRDWSAEPLALFFPGAILPGENELWVTAFDGDIWHIDTETGKKTLLGFKESLGAIKDGMHLITHLGDDAIVVPYSGIGANAEFSHVVIDLETNERRAFKNPDTINTDLIGLPNGNLLGTGANGSLVIFNGEGQTLVKTGIYPDPQVNGFAIHPDGRVIGIATAGDLSGTRLVEINPETAAVATFATLPGILPTRLAIGPDGTYYAATRVEDDDFTLYKIDGLSFAVSEIPLSTEDFRLWKEFDLDVDSDGRLLINAADRRTRKSFETPYPVILTIDPVTFDVGIAVGGWNATTTAPKFMSMGQDEALYFTGNQIDDHRVLRQDLRTGGITVVTSNVIEGAVLDNAEAIAADGDDIYVINNEGNPDWEHLVHVDRLTGAQTMLGPFGARLLVQQMHVDPSDGSLLLATWGATQESFRAILRVVPQENPVFERINSAPFPGNPMFFDIAPDGSLIVYVEATGATVLYRLDRTTGEFAPVGDRELPGNYTGPVVVLDDGTIVARGYRDNRTRIVLETINPDSGAGTEVFDSPPHLTHLNRMPRATVPQNEPPTVTIDGGNRTVVDSDGQQGEIVSLSATTADNDGSIASIEWFIDGAVEAAGADTNLFLPDGITVVAVRATDNDGASSTDSVSITVEARPDDGWPVPFNGITPDPGAELNFNNIGFFNESDQLLYACMRILANGEQADVGGIERWGIIFDNLETGSINIVNARQFNPAGYLNENLEVPDCSGEFELTTGVYTDVIKQGSETVMVSFQLSDPVILQFSETSREVLYSELPTADPAYLDGTTLVVPALAVGDTFYEVMLQLTLGSDPIQFVLTGASEVADVGMGASVFDDGILYIPSLVVGDADYRLELMLVIGDSIIFQLKDVFLN